MPLDIALHAHLQNADAISGNGAGTDAAVRAAADVGAPFDSFIRYNAERGQCGSGEINAQVEERVEMARTFRLHLSERTRPNGRILAIRGEKHANGALFLFLAQHNLCCAITTQKRTQKR